MPRLVLFAGPNGSGKSTITTPDVLTAFDIPANRYINADDIARALKQRGQSGSQEESEREAFRRARSLRATYREQGESFAFETVFSHPSTLLDMHYCRALGFEIVVLFVTTRSPEINVERVSRRFLAGGHDVPMDRIRSRYQRTMRLLPRIVEDADRAFVYDNSSEDLSVYAYERGLAVQSGSVLPAFFQQQLAQPLANRKRERDVLASQFGITQVPDEASGEYRGQLLWTGEQYAVQETANGLTCHDLLLFDVQPPKIEQVTIRYKDNAASCE